MLSPSPVASAGQLFETIPCPLCDLWLSVHVLYYTRNTMLRQLQRAGFSNLWQQTFWQTLPTGYVLQRAAPYFPPAAWFSPVFKALGLSHLPFTYNMGQTLAVSRK